MNPLWRIFSNKGMSITNLQLQRTNSLYYQAIL
jgi:hypothetical protein